ncbi:hypothetical protein ACFLZM_08150 [Thermodesulfobacteriota bacterium]
MGKGEIISAPGEGLYWVKLKYNRTWLDKMLARLQAKITDLETKAAGLEDGEKKSLTLLEAKACQKRIDYLNEKAPEDPTVGAWCADYTSDLSGEVGTIEVDGQTHFINIQPGHDETAGYNQARDGQLVSMEGMHESAAFVNFALFPGWQKWKPLYKYATISNIVINDPGNDTCTVTMIDAPSDALGLNTIAQAVYTGVEIDYMDCDGLAFTGGDTVLVKFENQDPQSPKVVGFKDHPHPCGHEFIYIKISEAGETSYSLVWNAMTNGPALIDDGAGGYIQFPCPDSELSTWLAATSSHSNGNIYSWTEAKDATWAPNETPVLSNNTGCGDLYYWTTTEQYGDYWHAHLFMVASGAYGSSYNLSLQNSLTGNSCFRVRTDYERHDVCTENPNYIDRDYKAKWVTPIGTWDIGLGWDFEATITDETACLTNWIYKQPDYDIQTGDPYEVLERHAIYSDKTIVQIYAYEQVLNEYEADPEATRTCVDVWCGYGSYACDDCLDTLGDGKEILIGSKANVDIAEQYRQRRCLAAVDFYEDANYADPQTP